jgi:arginyl-tRNA--protein-N-Asp/Glu arginylyltransferase
VTDPGSSADPRARLAALVDSLGLAPSPPSPCPYLPGRDSRLVAVNPERLSPGVYRLFLDLNFRRLGSVVYRPACDGCRECRQLRVDAARFRPTRAQRRCLRQNADVSVRSGWPEPTAEKHEVYRRYLDARHDGQMSGSWGEFQDFLHEAPPFTREVVFRVGERLLGAGIYDAVPGALSAVYFYFDPDLGSRSPGTLNVLWLVEECRRLGFPWLYLGYHVPGSPSMSYKARFSPHEILFDDGQWR